MTYSTKLFAMIVLLVLFISVPVLAQEETTPSPDTPVEYNITLTDYKFVVQGQDETQPLTFQAGQAYRVNITSASQSKIAHEILFGKNANVVAGTSHLDYADPLLADVEVAFSATSNDGEFTFVATGMSELEIAPGQQLTLEFTLPDSKIGDWEIGCFEFMNMANTDANPGPTHYDVGMHLPVKVTAATS